MQKLLPVFLAAALAGSAQAPPAPAWKFAVSGDSRNCGDIVMPAIAGAVLKSGAKFYWHLGDFRAIYDFDEDMAPPASLHLNYPHLNIITYLMKAWPDFIEHQLKPFDGLEVFLGIGNHETVFPATHESYVRQFKTYLDTQRLREQRLHDRDKGGPRTYYHWIMNGSIDFLSLDNASGNAFDSAQMAWVRRRLAEDKRSRAITTVVLGAHEALPGSKGMSHSMCDAPVGITSGREVYELLWRLQQAGKKVYILASHSHFVMEDVYNTSYWKDKVLPGWIVGTAGAVRYRLPAGAGGVTIARTDVYGYLLATVMTDGTIHFDFHEVTRDDLHRANAGHVPDALVNWCYAENSDKTVPLPHACGEGAH